MDDLIAYQRALRRERLFRDHTNPMDKFDDVELVEKFRFRRAHIEDLANELNPHFGRPRGPYLAPILQLCLALRFFASGAFQDTIGEMIGVSQSTVSRAVRRVIGAMMHLVPVYIQPPERDEVNRQKKLFAAKGGFPGIFACIDGTQVKIQAPRTDEADFVNRKNFHSLNVQVVCDADLKIIDCVPNNPGSFHDARILRQSYLYQGMGAAPRRVDGVILGDSAYPIREWLQTPYGNPDTAEKAHFYNAHKVTRVTIERCIGVLKRRWHCLHTELRVEPQAASQIIYCCCLLHNKAVQYGLLINEQFDVQEDLNVMDARVDAQDFQDAPERVRVNAGKVVREQITRNFFS